MCDDVPYVWKESMKKSLESNIDERLWHNKPLLKNSLLVWDVENISINCLDTIKRLAKFTPEKRYAISKKPFTDAFETLLSKDGFILSPQNPQYADAQIVHLIDTNHHSSHLILVSSDGDFVPVVKRFLEKHPVQWMMQDCNKKRICMNINLAHPNLRISTIDMADEYPKRNDKKRNKPAFYAPHNTSFANEIYWLRYFARYHAHIG